MLVQYIFSYFVSFGYTGERLFPGLDTERLDIIAANFVFGSNEMEIDADF